jgi:hypothetical protein
VPIALSRSASFRFSIACVMGMTYLFCFENGLKLDLVNQAIIQQRLEAGKTSGKNREQELVRLFRQAGCETTLQRVNRRSSNVICALPGETTDVIMAGGHFDFADQVEGIIDDWSGASLLPSLYQALKPTHQRHTYLFVAFAGEESGYQDRIDTLRR